MLDLLRAGRTSLREAMRELEATSIVEVRHGSGASVGHLTLRSLHTELLFHARLAEDPEDGLRRIVEVREALELGLVTALAGNGCRPGRVKLIELLQQMDAEARSGHINLDTDRAFHLALYEPLENPVVMAVLSALWDTISELMPPVQANRRAAEAVADRHHSILLAVEASDPRGARAAMQMHFDNLRDRLGMSRPAAENP